MNEQKIEMVREQITSCDNIYIVEKGSGTRTPTYFVHFTLSRYEGPEKVLLEVWRKPELKEVDVTHMNFTKKSFDEAWLEDGNFVLKTDKGVEIELELRNGSRVWMRAEANWVPYTMLETPPELAMLSSNLSKEEGLTPGRADVLTAFCKTAQHEVYTTQEQRSIVMTVKKAKKEAFLGNLMSYATNNKLNIMIELKEKGTEVSVYFDKNNASKELGNHALTWNVLIQEGE